MLRQLLILALVIGVAAIVVACMRVGSTGGSAQPAAPNEMAVAPTDTTVASIQWDSASIPLPAEHAIEAAVLMSSTSTEVQVRPSATVIDAVYSQGWAAVHARIDEPGSIEGASEPVLILAQEAPDGWIAAKEGDPGFCSLLSTVPDSIVPLESKAYYIGCP